jgi:GT2 family glycosyltransferase
MRQVAMSAPKVVVLILTWNRRDDVLRCVASLARLTYANYLAVVIDNGSTDGTVAALRQRSPDLQILENRQNLGYAGGNNVGIRWALQREADYVLIINNDTEVTPEMLTELVRVAETDSAIGVVGCRNVFMDDVTRLWGAYGALTYGPFVVRTIGEAALDEPCWHVVRDVDWVIGNGYLWRRATIERVGLLDERFFAYNEDVDWCLRARAVGFRVVYAGTAAILHRGGAHDTSALRPSLLRWYAIGRNSVLLARKHGRWHQQARFALLGSAAWAFRMSRALLRRLVAEKHSGAGGGVRAWDLEVAFARGMLDGLRSRPIPFDRLGAAGPTLPPAP